MSISVSVASAHGVDAFGLAAFPFAESFVFFKSNKISRGPASRYGVFTPLHFPERHKNGDFVGMPLRNCVAPPSAKYNKVRIDGEPYQFSGFLFAADLVNVGDEITKTQYFLLLIGFHSPRA